VGRRWKLAADRLRKWLKMPPSPSGEEGTPLVVGSAVDMAVTPLGVYVSIGLWGRYDPWPRRSYFGWVRRRFCACTGPKEDGT
jgi:hypothetical protein